MIPRCLPLIGALLAGLTSTSCEINLGYQIVSDGFRFDYEGASAIREDAGALRADLSRLEVDHIFGDVEVAGVDGVEAGWAWSCEVWAEDPEEAEWLAGLISVVEQHTDSGSRLELMLPEEHRSLIRGVRSQLIVTTPSGCELTLENRHGDSLVQGLQEPTRLETRHGDVRLDQLGARADVAHAHGELFATSISEAHIDLSHGAVIVRSCGPIRAEIAHADVVIEDAADDLEIEVHHGNVEIHGAAEVRAHGTHGEWRVLDANGLWMEGSHSDVEARLLAGDAEIEISHGDVTVERTPMDGSSQGNTLVRCHHGDVEADLPAGRHADIEVQHGDATLRHSAESQGAIDARARHGDIRSDLPVVGDGGFSQAPCAVLRTSHGNVRCVQVGGASPQ